MKGGANMRKYNISLFALIALISLLFLTNFVGAVYVSGYVTPNGSVSNTWAHFETVETHPYSGFNTGTANVTGCYTASVMLSNGSNRVNESGCYWNSRSKTAISYVLGEKKYPYASWLGQ